MKKNRTMRVAALLLVLTLMTSCFVGGTFAKYTTYGEGLDSARVAKWGVVVTADGKAFSNAYKDVAETTASLQTVVSEPNTDKIVAPGTEGTLSMFNVTGKPEVDVRVSYNCNLDLGDNWKVGTDVYCPIVITVVYNGNTEVFYMDADMETSELETKVENYINNSCAVVYDANTDLSTVNDDLKISWKWYFEGSTPGNPLGAYQNDSDDSDLGDLTADADDTNDPKITFTIACTITQVD